MKRGEEKRKGLAASHMDCQAGEEGSARGKAGREEGEEEEKAQGRVILLFVIGF